MPTPLENDFKNISSYNKNLKPYYEKNKDRNYYIYGLYVRGCLLTYKKNDC
jgi:hypothetical protein